MEENFTEVLECLDGIDSVSERTFNALCPNHDDHNPSLRFRIFDTEEGHKRLTFWCDVCGEDAQEAIREKLGLGWRAFSTEYRGRGAVRTTAVYEYTAADGTLLYKVLRREDGAGDKYFPQYHPDPAGGEDLPGPGPVKVPFNLPGVQRAVARGDLVINVEGEKDALNGERHLGYCFTTSSGGAKNFSRELVPHFVNADLVFIPDNDAAGRAHVLEAANMVLPVAKRVRLLDLPVTGEREDLSDWIRNYGGTREQFDKLLAQARVFTPEEKDGGEDLGFVRFAELGKPKPREFVVSTLMPARHITMLFGAGGVTKSYIALLIAVSIASGRREIFGYPIERHGEVVYADFELDVDEQHNRVEEVCCGLGIRVPRNLQYISGVEMGSVEAFKRLHALTKRERIELVVIDSLAYAVAGTSYSVIAEDVLEFYNKYTNPLRANGATPLVVHHRPYLLDKPYGSVYNVNNSRFVLEVEKKPKDQDGDGMLLRFRPQKKNLGAEGVVFGQRVKFRDDRVTFEDWTPPEDEGDAETGGRVTAADKIKATMTDGPKTKPEIHKLTAIPLPTINNNLSALGKTGEVIKLDQKVDGYALFALPGGPHERPGTFEDKDVLEGPRAEVYLLPTPLVSGKSVNEEPPARGLITSDEHLEELVGSLAEADTVAIDVETGPREKGLDPVRCTPGVLSISTTVMTAVVQLTKISDDVVKDLLYSLSEKTLLGHNLKFDLRVLRHRYGYEHEGSTQDTYILKRMIHFADGDRRPEDGKLKVPESVPRAKLGELVEDYLVEELPKTEQVSDWLTEELSDEQVEYARRDTAVLRRLWDAMLVDYRRIIRETSKALGEEIDQDAALDLEGKFLPALVWMESNGFAINTDKWQALADEYTKVVADAEAQMLEIVEAPKYGFNLNSDAQMLTILEALDADLSKLSKTKKTGRPSLAGDSIKKVKGSKTVERFVELHQKRKAAAKYASTYGLKWIKTPEELPELGYTKTQIPDHQMVIDGRVRSNFKQIVRTGRLGSGSPNLQNMPSATKSDHRAALEAPEGRCLSIADYRQIELVVAAIVGNDEEMLAALKDPDRDLHTEMAEDLGKDRGAVKAVNFGRLYLRGAKSISKKDDIPLKEAQELVTAYDERWKDTKAWHYREAEKTTRGDRVVTEAGRVRKISLSPSYKDRLNVYLPEWINHRVQGTAGDGMKLALTRIYQARHEILGNVLLVDAIHDETVVEVDVAQRKAAGKRIEEIMVSAMREVLGVPDAPVRVKTEVAYDYSAAKEVEDE